MIRVNGQELPVAAVKFELDRLVKFYSEHMSAEQIRAQMGSLKRRALDQAIGAKLLIDETVRLDIKVPKKVLEDKIEQMIAGAGGPKAFEGILDQQKLTVDEVRASIERGCRVDLLIDDLAKDVPEPTEDEMVAHFKAHAEEYRKPDRAQIQHILMKVESGKPADMATAKSRMLEIRKQMEDGADFADLAAAHSDCPSGKKSGGSLGWLSRGMMVPELDEAAFSMEIDTLSEVIESPLGLHLLRKNGHEEGAMADFDEVRDKVLHFLRHARRGELISAHVAELRKDAVVEED